MNWVLLVFLILYSPWQNECISFTRCSSYPFLPRKQPDFHFKGIAVLQGKVEVDFLRRQYLFEDQASLRPWRENECVQFKQGKNSKEVCPRCLNTAIIRQYQDLHQPTQCPLKSARRGTLSSRHYLHLSESCDSIDIVLEQETLLSCAENCCHKCVYLQCQK